MLSLQQRKEPNPTNQFVRNDHGAKNKWLFRTFTFACSALVYLTVLSGLSLVVFNSIQATGLRNPDHSTHLPHVTISIYILICREKI
jgi:hypothetical protein